MFNSPVLRRVAACTAIASVLAACSGGATSRNALPSTPTIGAYSGPPALSAFIWGQSELKGATLVGPAAFGALSMDVGVKMRDESGLIGYAQSVSNPSSASYRHFLTPQQIADRYGATQSDYAAAAQYFRKYGIRVAGWPQRLTLAISGTQPQLQRAFGTTFSLYQRNGKSFIAPSTTPHFEAPVAVSSVSNLVTIAKNFRQFVPVRAGNSTLSGYSPAQIRKVFDYTSAYSAGYNGTGINLGIIGTGPISPADVPAYGAMFHVSAATVTQVNATDEGVAAGIGSSIPNPTASPPYGFPYSSGLQSPPPVTPQCLGPLPSCNPEDGEAQLDTEQAATLAPGANVLFYLAYNPNECYQPGPGADPNTGLCPSPGPNAGNFAQPAIGLAIADDEIQQAIADNSADVLSLSYGGSEEGNAGGYFDPSNPAQGLGPAEFAALTAEGVAVFASSGDSGAEDCHSPVYLPNIDDPCVSYPSGDLNVVSVGGVTTPMDQFGNLTNQLTAWGVQTAGGVGGSGGGISTIFPQPAWQAGLPGVQGSKRNQPDVALEADSHTGIAVLLDAGMTGSQAVVSLGGTSVAAPEMAAMWALVLQACKASAACNMGGTHGYRLGNPAPLLYGLYYRNHAMNPEYASVFFDVLYGDNAQTQSSLNPSPSPSPGLDQGYNAGPGYDLVTGLGVPYARHLIKAVTQQ